MSSLQHRRHGLAATHLLLAGMMLVATALLTADPAASAERQRRLPIVDRAIEFHGNAVYSRSEIRLRSCSKSGCFRIHARVDRGLFAYDAVNEANSTRVRVTNDKVEAWMGGEPIAMAREDEQRYRDWMSQRVYFPFLPFRLNDDSVLKEDMGIVDWQGRSLHLVKISFDDGSSSGASSEYLYWFDPESARMEQFAYSYKSGLRFQRAINYRRVGGVLFCDRENFGIDAENLDVDLVDPSFVEQQMRKISTIRLDDIEARALR